MKKALPLAVLALIAVAMLAVIGVRKGQEKAKEYGLIQMQPTRVTESSSVPTEMLEGVAKVVKAEVEYDSPGGLDKVRFELSVDEQGVIVAVAMKELLTNSESLKYQQNFARQIPGVIQGKKLAELTDLDIVGRASLTTDAFNQALPALKKQLN